MNTKYEIIINYIRGEIENGNFKAKLPSIRALSIKFNCSNSTVIRAYSELEKENLIYALPKSGYFVVDKPLSDFWISDSTLINFSSGEPEERLLPYEEFSKSMQCSIDRYKQSLFSYSSPAGFLPLRETLKDKFKNNFQKNLPLENIYISSGAQQAITLLSMMPFPNNKNKILVEQPSYNIFLGWIKIRNYDVIGIERGINGIDLDELENLFKNEDIKFFYTMPRLQNPLGLNYSEEQKSQIAKLADKYNVYIIEDDYLSDLNEDHIKPLFNYDISNKVIYIKSFSKILMPGIRIAAMVLPSEIVSSYDKYKVYHELMPVLPTQGALNDFILNNSYSNYLNRIKKYYKKRMSVLNSQLEILKEYDIQYTFPSNGLFGFIKFNNNMKIDVLINSLNSKEVQVRNGMFFYIDSISKCPCIRLSITKVNEEKILKGSNILINEIQKMLKNQYPLKNTILEI
ncbi:PLP-dependent aminotransferase family protein [Desnuesiella massiliensis]|uniref:aminotransferase-like domain-containing protein n=1 Tax=Desnuesiella massiliensis TaxID=1650662 RepID=UPI0006E19B1C|nr:PLP-dependent aminotransferase family protein [Desnuesiella massiliensis]